MLLNECDRTMFSLRVSAQRRCCYDFPTWKILSVLLICCMQSPATHGTASVYINFQADNKPILHSDGADSRGDNRSNDCLTLCLGNSMLQPCDLVRVSFPILSYERRTFVYHNNFSTAPDFHSWLGSMIVTIYINDNGTSHVTESKQFQFNISSPNNGRSLEPRDFLQFNPSDSGTRVLVSVSTTCDDSLDKVSKNDKCQNFQNCTSGEIICDNGKDSSNCNVSLFSEADCEANSTGVGQMMTTKEADTTSEIMTSTLQHVNTLGEVFVTGPVPAAAYAHLRQIVSESLHNSSQPVVSCCYSVTMDDSDFYFDKTGRPLVRLEYTLTLPSKSAVVIVDRSKLLTEMDLQINSTTEFNLNNNHVYRDTVFGPDVVFDLDIAGEVVSDMYGQIAEAVTAVWTQTNPACSCLYHTRILHGSRYVGRYGTQLTRIYYIVYKDGTVQPVSSKGRPTLPDVMTSLKTSSVSRDLYMSTDAIPYHLHFQALDANVTAVTSRKQQLTVAWQRYLQANNHCQNESCNVTIEMAIPEEHYTNKSNEVFNLIYFIFLNGNIIKPTSQSGPLLDAPVGFLAPCLCEHRPVLSIYLHEHAPYFQVISVVSDLIRQEGAIVRRDFAYDMSDNVITKVIFKPTYFDAEVISWSREDIGRVENKNKVTFLEENIFLRRRYQVVIGGRVESDNQPFIRNVLLQAWILSNNDISPDDIHLSIIRVDLENSLKRDGSAVTVLDYTVAVGPVDSSLTRAEEPSLAYLLEKFGNVGIRAVCLCEILKLKKMTIRGSLEADNSSHVRDLEDALTGAWREANTNYTGDIKATLRSVTLQEAEEVEQESNQERLISFTLDPNGGQIGVTDLDLITPSDEVINRFFRLHDLDATVVSATEGQEEYFLPWFVPAGAVLAGLVIVLIFVTLYRIHRESREKKQKKVENIQPELDKENCTLEPTTLERESFRVLKSRTPCSVQTADIPDVEECTQF